MGIMLGLDLIEGAERQSRKEFRTPPHNLGESSASVLRLVKPWRGTGRVVIVDGAFTSVILAVYLFTSFGLFMICILKT